MKVTDNKKELTYEHRPPLQKEKLPSKTIKEGLHICEKNEKGGEVVMRMKR